MTHLDAAVPGLLFGLANSAHCAGMCGVFAFRAGAGGAAASRGAAPVRFAAYAAGKTFTYLALGAVAGWLGARAAASLGLAQAWLGVGAGGLLLVVGVRMLLPRRASAPAPPWLTGPFLDAVRQARATGSPFLFGAATGALPCGVVYLAALQASSSASPIDATVSMAAFGAGTLPVLAACAWLGNGIVAKVGPSRLRVAGAVLVLASGLVTTVRAVRPLVAEPPPEGGLPCCH